jgi:phage baseplate assembly protein W
MAIKNIYNDLKYGFDKLHNGDISLCYDENSINQSLLTLFSTKRGERFFNPSYGSDIYKYLYEPFDKLTADNIVSELSNTINFWEGNRLSITSINIDLNHSNLAYNVKIIYSIKSTPLSGTFEIKLQKV